MATKVTKIPPQFAEKYQQIQSFNYAGQGKWFLNAFWPNLPNVEVEAEQIWKWAQKFAELDFKRKKEGTDLDELESHKFLESLGESMTAIEFRQKLREIDVNNNNRMSFIEYLGFKYKKSVQEICEVHQSGVDPVKLKEAEDLIEQANQSLTQMQTRLQEQKEALERQKQAQEEAQRTLKLSKEAEEDAKEKLQISKEAEENAKQKLKIAEEAETEQKKKLEEQKRAEDEVRKAEEEQRQTLQELERQEKEYKDKVEDLERKSNEGSTVQKNKAATELAALKSEDPMPLRRAKINQEAALRKAEKLTKAAQEITSQVEKLTRQMESKRQEAQNAAQDAENRRQESENAAKEAENRRLQAEAAAKESEQKRLEAEESTRQVEAAVKQTEKKVQDAEDNFNRVKEDCKAAFGDIFWMDRDLREAKKYLPKSKQ